MFRVTKRASLQLTDQVPEHDQLFSGKVAQQHQKIQSFAGVRAVRV